MFINEQWRESTEKIPFLPPFILFTKKHPVFCCFLHFNRILFCSIFFVAWCTSSSVDTTFDWMFNDTVFLSLVTPITRKKEEERTRKKREPSSWRWLMCVCVCFAFYSWNSIWCCTSGNQIQGHNERISIQLVFHSVCFFFISFSLGTTDYNWLRGRG